VTSRNALPQSLLPLINPGIHPWAFAQGTLQGWDWGGKKSSLETAAPVGRYSGNWGVLFPIAPLQYTWKLKHELGGMIQMVEHLPGKCEALSSVPSTTKKKKKKPIMLLRTGIAVYAVIPTSQDIEVRGSLLAKLS
jgi:hypothetical protein